MTSLTKRLSALTGSLALMPALIVAIAAPAFATEVPVGNPIEKNGMNIAAIYLQSVKMAPMLPGMDKPTDVHLEADIHAVRGNEQGFRDEEWIPYLTISYHLVKLGSEWQTTGSFMPMCANDGPHYGDNVKLDGPGKYRLTYHILPPAYDGFYHHVDKETGTKEWWEPFDVTWDFTYVGVGKKGGY